MSAPAAASFTHASADERRVQPRHFHAGPNPVAASSDGDAAPVDADGPPPAAMLYRHALECVFAFFSQTELAAALQVSRDWLAAVKSMASLRLVVEGSIAELRVVAASTMGRHVSQLGSFDNCRAVALTGDTLFLLARLMPHLRTLGCDLTLPPSASPLLFPANLRKLQIDLRESENITAADVNTVLRAISGLTALESLTIYVKTLDPQISFAPLAALAQLRDFEFWSGDFNREFSEAQTDELRAMPQLWSLVAWPMTIGALRRLLRQPHNLQWQYISLPRQLNDETAALLPQLPSLTKLDTWPTCSRFDWLRGLPNLRTVRLSLQELAGAAGRVESLVAGLQSCANIETLILDSCSDLTAAHLTALLPRLPRLRELELTYVHIDSLAFLAQAPMTSQLCKLRLVDCRQLSLVELRHVHSLHGLRQLSLLRSFTSPMDEHSQWLLTPPSAALPQLAMFEYTAAP